MSYNLNTFIDKNTIVLLGDSYSELHKGGAAPGVTTPLTGFFNSANTALNKKFQVLAYSGIAGQTTTQILARVYTDCINIKPSWANIQGGINDINASVTSTTIYNNLVAMYDACISSGIKVIGYTIPLIPLWSGVQAKLNIANEVNARLKQYARSKSNFILIDWNIVLTDQTTGIMKSTYSYDTTHLSVLGAAIAGDYIYNKLKYFIDYVDMLPYSNNDEYSLNTSNQNTNLCPNPMLTGNVSGLATSWFTNIVFNGGGTPVLNTDYTQSKVAASGYRSFEWQQLSAIAATAVEKQFAYRPSTSAMNGRWSVGDYLYCECEFETDSNFNACTRFQLALNTLVSSGSIINSIDNYINGTTNGSYPSNGTPAYQFTSGVMRTYPVQMTNLVTAVYPEFQFRAIAGTIRIGRFAIRKATPITIGSVTVFQY